jgi:ribosomal protein S18 acetylase RimI-like enzyme
VERYCVAGTTVLSAEERAAVEILVDVCNHYEQLHLIFDLESGKLGPDATVENVDRFLVYDRGTLIGFARMDGWAEPELCGVVDPGYRRQGIGRLLLAAARHECKRRGVQQMLLICDEAAASGSAFAAGVGAELRYAEYRMRLDPAAIERSRPRNPTLKLRTATVDDLDLLTRLQAAAFGDSEREVRTHLIRRLEQASREYLIGLLDDLPIGVLCLGRYQHEADITAFGVLPEYQGRGYGRQMLLDAIDLLLTERWEQIMIDVVVENRNALKLYQSCGFRAVSTYGFYALAV